MKNFNELDAKICSCTADLNAKLDGSNGKRAILLCGGTGCLSSNSMDIKASFEELVAKNHMEDKVTVNIVGCFGFCSQGPFVKIYPEDTLYRLVKPEDVEEIFEKDIIGGEVVERLLYIEPLTGEKVAKQEDINFYKKQRRIALHGGGVINPEDIEEAMGYGAFQGLKRALTMEPKEVIDEVLAAGLRGRGGAGFPTGRKWSFAYANKADQKYVVCNGDEGDPGAFMDRSILEGNPYAVIEGMMIAGYAIGATEGYFYVRAEYPIAVNRLQNAIDQMNEAGILGENIMDTGFNFQAHIRLGAGAFVCGEETALLNSIEGKRGMPRPRPPFPAVKGLWGKPTIVNNVETLACVPFILREGAGEFSNCGTEKSKGTKVFALGGKVNNVGLVEIPMGTALLNYSGFQDAGVNVLVGFDLNTKKPAAKTEKKIYSMDLLDTFCEENDVRIGIISTPASEAQMVCEKFINNDIDIIWNFAPVNLLAPEGITVKNENLTASLMTLRMHMKENY